MINVAIISTQAIDDLQLLSQQSDIKAIALLPTSVRSIVDQLTLFSPDILVIEHGPDKITSDKLCHYLSKHFPNSRCMILTPEKPTFEMLQNSGFKARGYIAPEQRNKLDKAVRVINDGEAWLPRKLVTDLLNRFTASYIMHDELELQIDS